MRKPRYYLNKKCIKITKVSHCLIEPFWPKADSPQLDDSAGPRLWLWSCSGERWGMNRSFHCPLRNKGPSCATLWQWYSIKGGALKPLNSILSTIIDYRPDLDYLLSHVSHSPSSVVFLSQAGRSKQNQGSVFKNRQFLHCTHFQMSPFTVCLNPVKAPWRVKKCINHDGSCCSLWI